MDLKFLDFEQPIAELEAKIDELRFVGDDAEININEEVARLKEKSRSLTRTIFETLADKTAMLIGAGKMSEIVARHLKAQGIAGIAALALSPHGRCRDDSAATV